MLKDKEVISDPQQQYEIARKVHIQGHGGINKTTATIAEKYHWVRIKETVSLVIKNCPECKDTAAKVPSVRPLNVLSDTGGLGQLKKILGPNNQQNDPNSMIERLVNYESRAATANQRESAMSISPGIDHRTAPMANMQALQEYNDIPLDPQITGQHSPHQQYGNEGREDEGRYMDLDGSPQQRQHTPKPDIRMASERHIRQGDDPMAYQDGEDQDEGEDSRKDGVFNWLQSSASNPSVA